jgi:hypothetical protein
MLVIYLIFTIILFGITGVIVQNEINRRTDFNKTLLGGTYNVYRYYKYLKDTDEKLSIGYKLFLIAHINFFICFVVWIICFLFGD